MWTRPADVRAAGRKKWDSGVLLARFAAGQDWEPLSIPIRGPSASQIGERLAEARQWAAQWAEAARGPLRVEYKQVGGRYFGANSIPCRAWLDGYDEAWALLKVGPDVCRLTELIEAARGTRLVPWLTGHPIRALRLAGVWDELLATVRWIEERQTPGMYLRRRRHQIHRTAQRCAHRTPRRAAQPVPRGDRRVRLHRALRLPS